LKSRCSCFEWGIVFLERKILPLWVSSTAVVNDDGLLDDGRTNVASAFGAADCLSGTE
jgi:hypothetical protein